MINPNISVIVPVYNVEPYLRRCLDRLINQTLKNIEIICVNDCSSDSSLAILKEYAEKDKRVKIIDFEKNQGVSIARNAGMDMAMGEYIGIVDSDDYVDLDYYEKLYSKAKEKQLDIACAKLKIKLPGHKEYIKPQYKWKKLRLINHFLAMYKTEFIRQYSLKFPEGIKLGEDTFFVVQTQFYAKKVEIEVNTFYHYENRPGSAITNTENRLESSGILLTIKFINEKYVDEEKFRPLFEYFLSAMISRLMLSRYMNISFERKREYIETIIDIYKKRRYNINFENVSKFIQESDLENIETLLKKINENTFNVDFYELDINKINLQNRKLYIWGTGNYGMIALGQCENNEWEIEAFIDSNKGSIGTEFNGYKIISPQDVLSNSVKDYFIIIATILYANEIAQICEQAGLKEGVDFWRPH